MGKNNSITHLIWEAFAYGFWGTLFVLFFDIIKFSLTQTSCVPGFSCDSFVGRGIPIGGVFIGGVFSAIFVAVFFGKVIKSEFKKWFLILTITAITAISIQTVYIISNNEMYFNTSKISKILGFELMLELFVFLAPFTILFANRRSIIEEIQKGRSLN